MPTLKDPFENGTEDEARHVDCKMIEAKGPTFDRFPCHEAGIKKKSDVALPRSRSLPHIPPQKHPHKNR